MPKCPTCGHDDPTADYPICPRCKTKDHVGKVLRRVIVNKYDYVHAPFFHCSKCNVSGPYFVPELYDGGWEELEKAKEAFEKGETQ